MRKTMSEQTPITLDESMEIVLNVCGDWLADIDPEYSEDLIGVPVERVGDAYRFLRTRQRGIKYDLDDITRHIRAGTGKIR
jgi:hypothetical protein